MCHCLTYSAFFQGHAGSIIVYCTAVYVHKYASRCAIYQSPKPYQTQSIHGVVTVTQHWLQDLTSSLQFTSTSTPIHWQG